MLLKRSVVASVADIHLVNTRTDLSGPAFDLVPAADTQQ